MVRHIGPPQPTRRPRHDPRRTGAEPRGLASTRAQSRTRGRFSATRS